MFTLVCVALYCHQCWSLVDGGTNISRSLTKSLVKASIFTYVARKLFSLTDYSGNVYLIMLLRFVFSLKKTVYSVTL